MTTYEYVESFLLINQINGKDTNHPFDASRDNAINEAAQLISGSFTYQLYELAWLSGHPMDAITSHLENLYEKSDFHGFIYFLILFADSIGYTFPMQFYEMSMQNSLISVLAAAIIEDWLEYDNEYEEIEENPIE